GHAAEGAERLLDGVAPDAAAVGERDRGERVQNVVASHERKRHARAFFGFAGDAKMRGAVAKFEITGDPQIFVPKAVGFHRAKRLGQDSAYCRAFAPRDDATAARNQIDQAAKLQFYGGEIGVNIGMIEFERSDDQIVGVVVKEFRTLVEEGGIVFVALDDEFPAPAQAVARAEIFGHAADEEIGAASGELKNPGQQGGRGGFAVRAGHDERIVAREEKLLDHFRKRAVWNFVVENKFEFGTAAGDGVADDHEVGTRREIRFAKAVFPGDAELFEQRGSRG